MKKSERIEKINALNKNLESISGAAFVRTQLLLENQLKQLEQLKIYRDEYRQRLRNRCDNMMSPAENNDFHYFFRSLTSAIMKQEQLLEQLSQESEAKRQAWMRNRKETEKLEKMSEKIKVTEKNEENRKFDKEIDEINQLLQHFSPQEKLH